MQIKVRAKCETTTDYYYVAANLRRVQKLAQDKYMAIKSVIKNRILLHYFNTIVAGYIQCFKSSFL